jgi:dihydrolipoamide dehydrogenase
MATAWSQLGTSKLTVIQRGSRLIPNFEPFASEMITEVLAQRGVTVLTGITTQRVERSSAVHVKLSLDNGQTVVAEEVLVATGREPRTGDIGLETVGLIPGFWLAVDESMRVQGVPEGWLYAVGDVNHRALLTHMGKYQARACGDAIAARASGKLDGAVPVPWSRYAATADTHGVPQVIFTDPEVAAVGLTEAQAKARSLNVRVADYDIGRVAGAALFADDYSGRARIVVDEMRNVIVGATLVGPAVGELIHAATIAVVGAVPIDRLWHAVPAYPTISEVWLRLLETLGR